MVGPNGFQLCTCLQLLGCCFLCRHIVAALVTQFGRGKEFTVVVHTFIAGSGSLYASGILRIWGCEFSTAKTVDDNAGDPEVIEHDGWGVSPGSPGNYCLLHRRKRKYSAMPTQSLELLTMLERQVGAFIQGPTHNDPHIDWGFRLTGLRNPPIPIATSKISSRYYRTAQRDT